MYKRKPRPISFQPIHAYIKDLVHSNWDYGIPLCRDSLWNNLIIHVSSKKNINNDFSDVSKTFISKNDGGKSLNTFITRSLECCGFKARKTSMCQKLPNNWKKLAHDGALRVRSTFRKAGVDIVLSSDETFVKFHESTDVFLVPKVTKKVGSGSHQIRKSFLYSIFAIQTLIKR